MKDDSVRTAVARARSPDSTSAAANRRRGGSPATRQATLPRRALFPSLPQRYKACSRMAFMHYDCDNGQCATYMCQMREFQLPDNQIVETRPVTKASREITCCRKSVTNHSEFTRIRPNRPSIL